VVDKGELVKEGFVGIDLGFQKGTWHRRPWLKADMVTPVPGGVGPLTVVVCTRIWQRLGKKNQPGGGLTKYLLTNMINRFVFVGVLTTVRVIRTLRKAFSPKVGA